MRLLVPAVLLLVALIHAIPLAGVLGSGRLASLYGVSIADPNLEILMRHRAVLFGLLAAFLAWAAFRPELHALALIAAGVSVVSFLVLALQVGAFNAQLRTVVGIDALALVLLIVAAVWHWWFVRPW